MFVHPTVGQPPLAPEIEREVEVLKKYDAVPLRVSQQMAINATKQWSDVQFYAGMALGALGLLVLQWVGMGLASAVSNPTAVAEEVVSKIQGKKK